MKKQGLQISFAWIFAIIAGVFILFLAIYAVTKIIGTEQQTSDAEIAAEIGVLMNPLEIGFESGKTTSLILPVETRINNLCDDFGNFGTQSISVSQKSLGKWTDTNVDVAASNKYIFSGDYEEGKNSTCFQSRLNFLSKFQT